MRKVDSRLFLERIIYSFLMCLLFFSTKSQAQTDNLTLSVSHHFGKVVPHRSYFKPAVEAPAHLLELSFSHQTTGKKLWSQLYHYPIWGVSLVYFDLGNQAVLGQGMGIVPFFNFQKKFRPFSLNIKVGVGLSYVNRVFDAVMNPENNALSSHINNLTQLTIGLQRKINQNWAISLNGSLTHFSNGNTAQPNLGLNIMAINASAAYTFRPNPIRRTNEIPRVSKRFSLNLLTAWGASSLKIDNSPLYPVGIVGVYAAVKHSLRGQFTVGTQYEYHALVRRFIENNEIEEERKNWQSSKILWLVGYEFLWSRLSVHGQLGGYLFNPYLQKEPIALCVTAKYNFRHLYFSKGVNPFVGVQLKTHYFSADFTAIVLGFHF